MNDDCDRCDGHNVNCRYCGNTYDPDLENDGGVEFVVPDGIDEGGNEAVVRQPDPTGADQAIW